LREKVQQIIVQRTRGEELVIFVIKDRETNAFMWYFLITLDAIVII
jgi:hypothetical protein